MHSYHGFKEKDGERSRIIVVKLCWEMNNNIVCKFLLKIYLRNDLFK